MDLAAVTVVMAPPAMTMVALPAGAWLTTEACAAAGTAALTPGTAAWPELAARQRTMALPMSDSGM